MYLDKLSAALSQWPYRWQVSGVCVGISSPDRSAAGRVRPDLAVLKSVLIKAVSAVVALALLSGAVSAAGEPLRRGDIVVLKAQIRGCDDPPRILDVAEVQRSGDLVFFERVASIDVVRLSVAGLTVEKAADALADELQRLGGHRPASIELARVSGRELIAAKKTIVDLAHHRSYFRCNSGDPAIERPDTDPPDGDRPDIRDYPPSKRIRLGRPRLTVDLHRG